MNKKLQYTKLFIVPMLFLITLIYSIVTSIVASDSQNWYSFFGQVVLVLVWVFGNIGFKKFLKNKVLATILANVIFQLLLFAHIWIYLFCVMQATGFDFAGYLAFCFVAIGFVAVIILLCDLVQCVTPVNLFKNTIDLDADNTSKLNKIFLAIIPILLAWTLLFGTISISSDIMYLILNFVASIILIAVWIGITKLLEKYLKDKKSVLLISQIIFQVFMLIYVISSILLMVLVSPTSIMGCVYQYASLIFISIIALIVFVLQNKMLNTPKADLTNQTLEN